MNRKEIMIQIVQTNDCRGINCNYGADCPGYVKDTNDCTFIISNDYTTLQHGSINRSKVADKFIELYGLNELMEVLL